MKYRDQALFLKVNDKLNATIENLHIKWIFSNFLEAKINFLQASLLNQDKWYLSEHSTSWLYIPAKNYVLISIFQKKK